jgi:hypothetical protein
VLSLAYMDDLTVGDSETVVEAVLKPRTSLECHQMRGHS